MFVTFFCSVNCHNHFAVAAYDAVGLLLKEISRWSALFLDCGVLITGVRKHSREPGGMEIPCELTFIGKKKHIAKTKKLIVSLNSMFQVRTLPLNEKLEDIW